MNALHMFYSDKLDPGIAAELYDPLKPGAYIVAGFLAEGFREALHGEIQRNSNHFVNAERLYPSGVYQDFDEIKLISEMIGFPELRRFTNGFSSRCHELLKEGKALTYKYPNQVHILRYPANSAGISPHKDFTCDRNLISVLSVTGRAKIRVHGSGDDIMMEEYVNPGDLVLMRASREDEFKDTRPIHSISEVEGERIAVVFREVY